MKKTITFEIDTACLPSRTDEYVAALWYVAQCQPAAHGDHDAGEFAELVGREIIQRWMRGVPVPVWNIQGRDYYHQQLTRFARWNGKAWVAASDTQPSVPEIL
ncbi:hypothetical protein Q3P06_11810 [Ralstonia pseudosolanacearum]|uniref:hypothetical protein n=1 Tax=Ralstonia pseudosolanacearum TaxID=1310165 RepID=UPI002675CF06|nr:hypothetical protein [Ralstonia pseudosolanacearum]MDO3512604.1 hypothetical protein [Ralstonia pseudosolanacearum]MDO3630374.1 hypothetical protein [Ralstonia pseudosolanacearum]